MTPVRDNRNSERPHSGLITGFRYAHPPDRGRLMRADRGVNHTIPGITIQRGQALRSVHRSAQLAHQYRHLRSLRLKGSPARVSALAGPSIKLAIRPVTRAPSGRSPGPAALAFLLPFSHRHSLPGHPVPPGTSAPLTIGLPPGLHLPVPAGRTLTRFPRSARMRPGPGRAPSIPRGQLCPLAVDLSTAAACRLSAADP